MKTRQQAKQEEEKEMTVKPISPDEVKKVVPDFVIEAFNELIKENIYDNSAKISLKEARERVKKKRGIPGGLPIGWLDIEDIYRAVGWDVSFESPAYNESFIAYYLFKRK